MRPYSQDLREKIVRALEAQEDSQPEIADRFGVSLSFVEKLWSRWPTSGSCAALLHARGRKPSLKDHQALIRREVGKQADITLDELRQKLTEAGAATVSLKTICLELKRLRLPRKKSRSTTRSKRLSG